MSHRLSAIIPDEVWEEIQKVAENDNRTKSQMVAILLEEALKARREKSSEEKR